MKERTRAKPLYIGGLYSTIYPQPLGLVFGNKALIDFLDSFYIPKKKKKIAKTL